MYKIESLNKVNQQHLLDLNTLAIEIKEDTYDIFTWYNSLPWYKKLLTKHQIKVFKYDDSYIGYGFFIKVSANNYSIKSFYIKDSSQADEFFKQFLNMIGYNKATITYSTLKPTMNKLLQKNNFEIQSQCIEMWLDIECAKNDNDKSADVNFVDFIESKDELKRCQIQNSVFEDENRIPLAEDDILFEENQSYYIKGGGLFLVKYNKNIGYGQIILENGVPVIVNVGILSDYRGRGYGKLLIYALIDKVKALKYEKIKIRCYLDNIIALNLYKSIGFLETGELNSWVYEKGWKLK